MANRTPKPTHADNCGWCGTAFDTTNPYYCIAYPFKHKDGTTDSGNRYACRHDAACMAWATGHVVESS